MIRVEFDPGQLTDEQARWWERWEAKARAATDELEKQVEAEQPPDFQSAVWKELKEWLFRHAFFKKCAYCEGKVTPQSFGHAEHWRPKGAVKRRHKGKLSAVEVEGRPHPGYWWLAYEWFNLLPACEKCNSGEGKGAQFPIEGDYTFRPRQGESVDDLDAREKPLLLHPFRGPDPADHIGFNEFGQAYAIKESPLGKASIEVFDLKRPDLVEDRYDHLNRAADTFLRAAHDVGSQNCTFSEALGNLYQPSTEYAGALRHYGMRWLEHFVGNLRR